MGSHPSTHTYNPTVDDVFTIRRLLLRFVPAELANIILDEAHYWPMLACTYLPDPALVVEASSALDTDATKCCLLTPKLGDWNKQVKEVCFTIESHDQGWCSQSGFSGEYQGSWTWFEAAIVRHFRSDNSSGNNSFVTKEIVQAFTNNRGPSKLTLVQNPNNGLDVWHIQQNMRANSSPTLHQVRWTVYDDSEDDEVASDLKGSGLGTKFIQSLQQGDRIAVLARAQYPGWANHIRRVDFELYFSA